ncbi:hypothetical protein AALA61_15790 [Oscillospiraceae bacterium 42-9]
MITKNNRKRLLILLLVFCLFIVGTLTTLVVYKTKKEPTRLSLFEYSVETVDSITFEDHDMFISKTVTEPELIKNIISLLNDFSYVSTKRNPPAGYGGTSITIEGSPSSNPNKFRFTSDCIIFSEDGGYTMVYVGDIPDYFHSLFDILENRE